MKTVTVDVRPLADTLGDFVQTWKSGKASAPRISFDSPELLFKTLSGKRWELLNAMTGAGPMSIREAARRVERDVKAVHGDVTALLNAGIIEDRRWDDRLSLRCHPRGFHAQGGVKCIGGTSYKTRPDPCRRWLAGNSILAKLTLIES